MPAPYMYEPEFVLRTYKHILGYDVTVVSTEPKSDDMFVDQVSSVSDPATVTTYLRIMTSTGFCLAPLLARS